MEVKVAKSAGFCFGVKRAVDTVYEQIEKNTCGKTIYTYGPIIHNDEVVKDLKEKGVVVINEATEIPENSDGILIIRSHGVPKSVYENVAKKNLEIIDATCPFVKKIHKIVEKESETGKHIIIIGDEKHPEVMGIMGWSKTPVTVIGDKEQAKSFKAEENTSYCLVSQTTFNHNKFKDLVEIIMKKGYDILDLNTICDATNKRQEEAKKIANEVDTMIVIGDKHSSNTQKLFEICKDICKDTYYIQTLVDLDSCNLQSTSCVGITAGASTPNYIIEEVHTNVRTKF